MENQFVVSLLAVPALWKIGLSLALILVVQKLSRSLLAGVIAGSALLAFWAGHSPQSALDIMLESTFTFDGMMLLAVIVLVILLSSQMANSGMMAELVAAVQKRLNRRASVALLPALIGLLPMPGGALFSAPLIDDCDRDKALPPMEKTRANYWFRHIWEFWWPLYPGVLLTIELSGLKIWQLMVVMFPLTLISVLSGYLFILRRIPKDHALHVSEEGHHAAGQILPLLSPVLIVIATYIGFMLLLPGTEVFSKYLPMVCGLSLAVLFVQVRRPLDRKTWKTMILSRRIISMVAIVAVIRIYGAYIESPLPDGSSLIVLLRSELAAQGIPAGLLIILLPFIAALTTGLTIGFVGASFPVVLSLLGPEPTALQIMQILPFAYGVGFMGMMLSPVHVCLLVTNKHFNTGLTSSIRALIAPVAFTALGIMLVGGLWMMV
ncbi:DUF401 family protein [Marispirochaeta aestuarii]|uniref:DUF401 family protein n=1 Tax=Marispirochaeta aestuarii TaxID=1963862 RepID=UPI002ABDA6C0|nr:DUF401 family protein [Marispirochaeta aestuarii]